MRGIHATSDQFYRGSQPPSILETCSSEGSSVEAKDHTNFLVFMICLNGVSCVVYTFGFKADYRRRKAMADESVKSAVVPTGQI